MLFQFQFPDYYYGPYYHFSVETDIQPNPACRVPNPGCVGYDLLIEASASNEFFSSPTPDAFPITLDEKLLDVSLFTIYTGGGSLLGGTATYAISSDVPLEPLTFSPGTPVAEPTTTALAALCLFLLACQGVRSANPVIMYSARDNNDPNSD